MGYELCPGRNASLAPYTSTMQKTEVLQKNAAKKTILKWTKKVDGLVYNIVYAMPYSKSFNGELLYILYFNGK